MTGEYELLKKVLSTIEVKEGLNKDNIIEEIQEELKDQGLYKEWEKGKFDVNHGFGTFLIIAARNGYTKTVGVLLGAGADVNAKGGFECTALHHAASFGRKEIVEFLISKEADVNAKDSLGRTALNHAALCGRKEIVEFLISKEADVNAKDVFNRTALHHAAFDDHTKITKVLFEKGVDLDVDEFPLLYNGAKNGRVGTVGILLQKGANVNAVDKNGKTPLDYAKDQNVVKVLLDAGGRSFVKARNKAMIAGGVTTLLGTAIAVALFTTGTITAQLIPIVIAVVAVTAAALVVGCATYGLLKPSTKVDGAEKPIVNSINEQQGVTGISS